MTYKNCHVVPDDFHVLTTIKITSKHLPEFHGQFYAPDSFGQFLNLHYVVKIEAFAKINK